MDARNTSNTVQLSPAEHSVALEENTTAQHSTNFTKNTHTTVLYTQHRALPDDLP